MKIAIFLFLNLLFLTTAGSPATPAQSVRRPNVIFILSDDMGYADIGSYGVKDIRTPHLDRLAREGVRLTNCYSNGPVCTPTRAAFVTGRYQQRVNKAMEWAVLPDQRNDTLTADNYGRDHHPRCFTVWLAGGGIKPGLTIGETDDFSYNIARDPVEVHDLNATILHCLGLDHKKLTWRSQGRDFRLTDVEGKVLHKILA